MSGYHEDVSGMKRDPILAALVRFLMELLSWVAIWVAFGWPFAVLAVLALAIFNTPGDKRNVLVPIPGPIRLLLEVGEFLIGVAAAGMTWGVPGMAGVGGLFLLYLLTNRRRLSWLAAQSI